MHSKTIELSHDDQFIKNIEDSDTVLTQFFEYDAMDSESYQLKMNSSNNGREQGVSEIIQQYMAGLDLSSEQLDNLKALSHGAKVVIGGQQAGLLGGPLYSFHKIFSIITLARSLKDKFSEQIVPVFWIAGEDHDFDEVNHTFAYNQGEANLNKVKYHTLKPPQNSVTHYHPSKSDLKVAVRDFFKELPETEHTKPLIEMCEEIIMTNDNWSDMFRALIHQVFKEYGLLIIDAQFKPLREYEKSFLKSLLYNHQSIDQAFKQAQTDVEHQGLKKMIQTESNVHLFIEEDEVRELLTFEEGSYKTSKSNKYYTYDELVSLIDNEPERFSNNVVTRPLMQEWLFNTIAFIGGPSEIKYWAELNQIFKVLEIEMPIVLPRLRISYLNARTEKLLSRYQVDTSTAIEGGLEKYKSEFIRSKASSSFIQQVEHMQKRQSELYKLLKLEVKGNNDNELLVDKNNEIHQKQYEYLLQRYLLNIERENDISMKHFREIESVLHPMGGLQERIWNPLQIMNEFGTDVFSRSTFPPLDYTFKHILVKP
ncbi:bacillithiol biosynthesis cysteine-adding enzyme BshC [Staphylococcus sp. SQ8-PEA]|uniref:Putative cysteine ligase BshC n=1 Tax=Staphylococcus marylandisciuri TaxID=2981529 RepID=A0ABT2QP02_9STAP|nr:bacillithiol biosynthesis cysteine-adding enzyme BshC [Staphylococcus marylandisciuri]MCU5745713.1 bacillithiol biosynthesis cysteine-adding enzyme BshC [Staphylococcus marylandisciuri]